MKYKHRLIQQVKNKYGVPELNFFKGYRRTDTNDERYIFPSVSDEIIICSLDPDMYKKRKDSDDLRVIGWVTHTELEKVLSTLASNSRLLKKRETPWPIKIRLEPAGIEINDLISLKTAYLLTYLAGI